MNLPLSLGKAMLASLLLFCSGCAVFRPDPLFIAPSDTLSAAGQHPQGVVYDGLLFSAGFAPRDPKTSAVVPGDITAQTHRIMDGVEARLKDVGCTLKDVIKLNVYLSNFADYEKMNAVMDARFGDHKPSRTAVAVEKARSPVLLEVDLVARVP